MKRKKMTLKRKKQMFKGTFDPNSDSRYARKKKLQYRGVYSPTSPFRSESK